MRLSAINKPKQEEDNIVTQLGIRVNKLQILNKEDYIEIKPKEWIDKKTWREVNDILRVNGFLWLSCNIDSCWIKKT